MGFFSSFFRRPLVAILKPLVAILIFTILVLGVLFLVGPFFTLDPKTRFSNLPEIQNSHLVEGTEEISLPAQGQSSSAQKYSFSYIHGFSASRQEISPVVEDIAKYFAAPAFFIRLSGHGIDDHGLSFGRARCLNWLKDADRAVSSGVSKDRKLVLIGTSFGGLLASFATLEHPDQVKALILLSPLYDAFDSRAKFISGPLGPMWASFLIGDYREYKTLNEMHRKFFTYRYPSRVIPELMDCMNSIRKLDFSKIKVPLLMFYTEKDDVVSVPLIKKRFTEFASTRKILVEVPGAGHVLTGQILEPQTIPFVENEIKNFLESL